MSRRFPTRPLLAVAAAFAVGLLVGFGRGLTRRHPQSAYRAELDVERAGQA